ncbi:hypothetical protein PspLS_03129, partial [Pyricularia sp. CBS 133598]
AVLPPHPPDHRSGVDKMSFPTKYSDGLQSMLRNGELTDLTITCQDQTFNVHCTILSAQSDFFRVACSGNFKEALTGRINLPEDDPAILEILVEYVYRGQFPSDLISRAASHLRDSLMLGKSSHSLANDMDRSTSAEDGSTSVRLAKERNSSYGYKLWIHAKELTTAKVHSQIYLLADKYQVPSLQLCALHEVNFQVRLLLIRPDAGLECIACMLNNMFGKVANTKSHIELKEPLTRLAIGMGINASTWEDLQPVMRTHPKLSLGVANYYNRMNGKKCIGCCAEENKKAIDSGVVKQSCYSCDDGRAHKKKKGVNLSSPLKKTRIPARKPSQGFARVGSRASLSIRKLLVSLGATTSLP